MTAIIRDIYIDATPERVWEVLSDFGAVDKYNPGALKSRSTSTNNGGIGATRHCDLPGNAVALERITAWRPNEYLALEIFGGEKLPPFKKAVGSVELKPEGNGTLVHGVLEYSLKLGPIGSLMDKAIVSRKFAEAWSGVMAGLKHHVETGEQVEIDTGLERELAALA